jgi:hypothetical protein
MSVHVSPSLMELVLAGQVQQRNMADPETFAVAVQGLVEAACLAGAPSLLPADPEAAALIGGAVIAAKGELHQAKSDRDGRLPEKVLVVGATVVSGGLVLEAIQSARRLGAGWVGVWVWRAPEGCDLKAMTDDFAVAHAHYTAA